jgi:hypothetical protein
MSTHESTKDGGVGHGGRAKAWWGEMNRSGSEVSKMEHGIDLGRHINSNKTYFVI